MLIQCERAEQPKLLLLHTFGQEEFLRRKPSFSETAHSNSKKKNNNKLFIIPPVAVRCGGLLALAVNAEASFQQIGGVGAKHGLNKTNQAKRARTESVPLLHNQCRTQRARQAAGYRSSTVMLLKEPALSLSSPSLWIGWRMPIIDVNRSRDLIMTR